jgi:hypothetical protein
MGLSAQDLLTSPISRPPVPTFNEYIPVVSASASEGTRRVYDSYWNRIEQRWGQRRLDEPTPSEVKQLAEHIKANVVARRNARGGRSAGEHLIAALRCLYRHAEHDGLINPADNPARKVPNPADCPPPATPSPTPSSRRSTTPPPRPATTPYWTVCCCGCTPKPLAAAPARSPYAHKTSGVPPRFRITDPIRSGLEWRTMDAGEAPEI